MVCLQLTEEIGQDSFYNSLKLNANYSCRVTDDFFCLLIKKNTTQVPRIFRIKIFCNIKFTGYGFFP